MLPIKILQIQHILSGLEVWEAVEGGSIRPSYLAIVLSGLHFVTPRYSTEFFEIGLFILYFLRGLFAKLIMTAMRGISLRTRV